MRRLATLAPLALVAAVLAGCGSSSSTSSAPASSSNAAAATSSQSSSGGGQLTLSETEFKITPASPTVAKTGTITITVKNTGAVTHALSVVTPSGTVSTGHIAPGGTATLKVNATKAGKYTFFCPIPGHRAAGMQGVMVVGSASPSTAAPASSTTSSGGGGGSSGY
jgi:uncharacterized cupredoxin-like copper-binding protein